MSFKDQTLMNNHACYCVLQCLAGSWLVDSLIKIDEEQQQSIVDEFTAQYGQEELNACIAYVDSEFKMSLVPEFLRSKSY